jgi:predicted transcriptional regulator
MKRKILLVSIKPEFAFRILSGDKQIELRKSTPKVNYGDLVVIYATAPVKAIVGYCTVQEVVRDKPKNLWCLYGDIAGIDRRNFNQYYCNTLYGTGILLKDVKPLKEELKLKDIRMQFPYFQPPQSYKYLSLNEIFSTVRHRYSRELINS